MRVEQLVQVDVDEGGDPVWDWVEVLPAASAEVVVLPPSSQAGLAAVRSRIGGPVARPALAAYNQV